MKTIELTQGQVALVDDEDFEWLSQWKWYAQYSPLTKSYYAVRCTPTVNGKQGSIRMHRLILNAQKGEQVDHQNHSTLDNRRLNIRLTTDSGNRKNQALRANNRSGACGVYWDNQSKRWRASIRLGNKTIALGRFIDKADAITARQAANIKYGFHPNHGKNPPSHCLP